MLKTNSVFVDVTVGTDYAQGRLHLTGVMSVDGISYVVSNRIVELEDALIQQRLIEMGWQPPATDQNKAPK